MAEEKTVTLAIAGRDPQSFDPSIEGVEAITQEGTEVPASKEDEVRKAASESGVRIRKAD